MILASREIQHMPLPWHNSYGSFAMARINVLAMAIMLVLSCHDKLAMARTLILAMAVARAKFPAMSFYVAFNSDNFFFIFNLLCFIIVVYS